MKTQFSKKKTVAAVTAIVAICAAGGVGGVAYAGQSAHAQYNDVYKELTVATATASQLVSDATSEDILTSFEFNADDAHASEIADMQQLIDKAKTFNKEPGTSIWSLRETNKLTDNMRSTLKQLTDETTSLQSTFDTHRYDTATFNWGTRNSELADTLTLASTEIDSAILSNYASTDEGASLVQAVRDATAAAPIAEEPLTFDAATIDSYSDEIGAIDQAKTAITDAVAQLMQKHYEWQQQQAAARAAAASSGTASRSSSGTASRSSSGTASRSSSGASGASSSGASGASSSGASGASSSGGYFVDPYMQCTNNGGYYIFDQCWASQSDWLNSPQAQAIRARREAANAAIRAAHPECAGKTINLLNGQFAGC